MSDTTWALAGVIIGALLGGIAQMLAGVLTDRRAHQRWTRERRSDVYREFLAEIERQVRPVAKAEMFGEKDPTPEDYGFELTPSQAAVELFGSRSAATAAANLVAGVRGFADADPTEIPDKQWAEYNDALDAFRDIARSDLGAPD